MVERLNALNAAAGADDDDDEEWDQFTAGLTYEVLLALFWFFYFIITWYLCQEYTSLFGGPSINSSFDLSMNETELY